MADRRPLEEPTALSESILWKLMREYFQRERVRAWSAWVVPDMITTNAVVASAYARLLLTFLREWRASVPAPPPEPVHVVELGAGSGRFAHHFLQKFTPRREATPSLRDVTVRYVMTDLPGGSVDQWRRHPLLRAHAAAGRLDFATLDGTRPEAGHLLESGTVLGPGRASAPLVVIANYVFDSLPLDAFVVEGGDLSEYLVAVSAPPSAGGRPAGLDDLELTWSRRRIGSTRRFVDDELEALLRAVTAGGEDRSVLFPTSSIHLLRTLRSFTSGPVLVLTADKGFSHGPTPVYEDGPYMATHGSVSFMVDYTILGAFVRARRGHALLPDHRSASLTVACFVLDDGAAPWAETAAAYRDVADHGGPDDFFTLQDLLNVDGTVPTLVQLLARLRTSEWDPSVFRRVFAGLMIRTISAGPDERRDVLDAVRRVENLYFPIGEAADVHFELAMVRWRAGDPEGALRLLRSSENQHGVDPDRCFAAALCHVATGNRGAALEALTRALHLEPAFELAVGLGQRLSEGGPLPEPGDPHWADDLVVSEKVPGRSSFGLVT